jgi:hypothetical protein
MFDWSSLNVFAIIIGGIVYMVYGGIYYSVLLADKSGAKNKSIYDNQSKGPFKYIYSVIIAFISSIIVASLVQAVTPESLFGSAGIGFSIGFLITIVYIKNSLFGLLSRRSLLIAIGDHIVIFTLLGLIHGLFM